MSDKAILWNFKVHKQVCVTSLSKMKSAPSTYCSYISFSFHTHTIYLIKFPIAVIAETKQEIFKGVNLVVYEGEVSSKLIFSIVLGVDSHILKFSLIFCSFGIIFSDPSRFTPSWERMVLERAHLQRSILFVFFSLILIKQKRISNVLYQ